MNNDPNQDKRVSDTYRSLANEQAPPALDRKVLEMAAAAGKRRPYARWMSWTRPVAWAATITLCLAITLELSRDPSVISPDPSYEVATPSSIVAPQAEEKRESDQILGKSMDAEPEVAETVSAATMNDAIIAEKTAVARSSAKQAISQPAPARLRQSADLAVVEEEKEKSMSADVRAEAPAAMASAVFAESADADAEVNECSAEARAEAESWHECIQELAAAGDDAAALRQTDALKETFPDFQLP